MPRRARSSASASSVTSSRCSAPPPLPQARSSSGASVSGASSVARSTAAGSTVPDEHRYLTGTLLQRKAKNRYGYKKRYVVLDLRDGGSLYAYAVPPPPSHADLAESVGSSVKSSFVGNRNRAVSLPAAVVLSPIAENGNENGNGGPASRRSGRRGGGRPSPLRSRAQSAPVRNDEDAGAIPGPGSHYLVDPLPASRSAEHRLTGPPSVSDDGGGGGDSDWTSLDESGSERSDNDGDDRTIYDASTLAYYGHDDGFGAATIGPTAAGPHSIMCAEPLLGPHTGDEPKLLLSADVRWTMVDVRNHECLFVIEVPEMEDRDGDGGDDEYGNNGEDEEEHNHCSEIVTTQGRRRKSSKIRRMFKRSRSGSGLSPSAAAAMGQEGFSGHDDGSDSDEFHSVSSEHHHFDGGAGSGTHISSSSSTASSAYAPTIRSTDPSVFGGGASGSISRGSGSRNASSSNGTVLRRYYFKCPQYGNEKSLWLRAAAKLGRLSPQTRVHVVRNIFSRKRTKASRLRTENHAKLAERSRMMERQLTMRPQDFAEVALLERTDDGGYKRRAGLLSDDDAMMGMSMGGGSDRGSRGGGGGMSVMSPDGQTLTPDGIPIGPQSGQGHREFRVLPEYAYPHRWMTEEELTHEMLKPSVVFHDALDFGSGPSGGGANAAPIIGSLQVEVLSCLGLPNVKFNRDVCPVSYLVCGSHAFVSDVIPTRNNPVWPRKCRRAASFPLRHAYAQMCAGIFDATEEGKDDGFVGRVVLDVARLRPGCVYDVTLPLRQSSYVYARRRRGVIRLRFKLEWRSDKAAVLSYVPGKSAFKDMMKRKRGELDDAPAVTVRCSDPKAFRNVVLTVHGSHMPGRFSPKTFKATVRELLLYRIMITLLLKKAVQDIVQWRNPAVSLLIFFAWMHCIYANSMSLVPVYASFFALLFLVRNYALYNVSARAHWGYAPLNFGEMLWGLLCTSDAEWMKALEVEMRKRDEGASGGAAALLWLLGFADDGEAGDPAVGGAAETANIDHMEFPFSRGGAYPKMTVDDAVVRTRRRRKKNESKLVTTVPMLDLAASLYARPGDQSEEDEDGSNDGRDENGDEDDDDDWVVQQERQRRGQNSNIIGSEVVIQGAKTMNRGAEVAIGTVGRGAGVTIKTVNRGAKATYKTVDKGTRTTFKTVNKGAKGTFKIVDRGARGTLKAVDRGARTTLKTAGLNDNLIMSAVAMPVNAIATGIAAPIGASYGLAKSVIGLTVGAIIPGADSNAGAGGSGHRNSMSFISSIFGGTAAKDNPARCLVDNNDEGEDEMMPLRPAKTIDPSALALDATDLGSKKPLPEQNMDAKDVEENKDIKAELVEIKGKIHQDTFRLYDDRLFLMSEESMPAAVRALDADSPARTAAEEKRHMELQKQIGVYSYNNPVMARAAVILGPILSMVQIFSNAIRATFNIYMWKDPYMGFWASFACIIQILVLAVFPWRLFLFLAGVAGVGPQNFVYRKWKEKYGNRQRARLDTDESAEQSVKSGGNVRFQERNAVEKKSRFAFLRNRKSNSVNTPPRNKRKVSFGTPGSKASTATTARDDETISTGGGLSRADQVDCARPVQLFGSHVGLVDGTYQSKDDEQVCTDGYQEVVVPYTPLRQCRFYDWPPDPSVSRVTVDPIQNEAFGHAESSSPG